ncbi:MAG: hypothetical protein ACTSVD_05650 [Candidatus Thorarchaeota archaeon]|nr:MAG: hypothetical protein DRO73_00235 [Candidatus Thorarchaeota archaeon]RLI62229.1 MAG: hypothetical protein DRO93_01875 [Candidatus Thorarchaeota archaeon]
MRSSRIRKRLREEEESLLRLLRGLHVSYPGLVVVVEGRRDEEVLRDLGVEAPIRRMHSGRSIHEFVDELAQEQPAAVLVLVDFDSEGRSLAKRIESALQQKRIQVEKRLRLQIRSLMGNLRCIEELVAVLHIADRQQRRYE